MNRQQILGMWDHFRQVHGVTLRALAKLPQDKLDSHPIQGMRTPKELVAHTYVYCKAIPAAVLKGRLTTEDGTEPVDKIKTREDLLKYARDCFTSADASVKQITDAHLTGMVETFWGPTMPGFVMMSILPEEHLHHRGQLYAYLRTFGIEPPFMWGFEQNEPALQPQGA